MRLDTVCYTDWMARSLPVGTDILVGGTVTSVGYDGSVVVEKDGKKYETEVDMDWGYCYCYDYGNERCSCTPTATVVVREVHGKT